MKVIKKDTIIKVGDILRNPENTEQWEVEKIDGFKFLVKNPKTKAQGTLLKNELLANHWTVQIMDDRNYY